MKFRDEKDIPEGSGGNFIKFKDGESVMGIFMGDPYEFFTLWEGKKPTVVPESTPGSKFRFRINLVVREKNDYVAKIFEQGSLVYRRLLKLNNEFSGLENLVVKITRHGSTMNDTEYVIDPAIDPKTRQLITVPAIVKSVELLPLENEQGKKEQEQPSDFGPEPSFDSHDEIPF